MMHAFNKKITVVITAYTLAAGIATGSLTDDQQALYRAAQCGNIKTIERLLTRGCTINSSDAQGYTPLMRALVASDYNTNGVVNYLLENGANPSHQAHDGTTTLELAVNTEKMSLANAIMRRITQMPFNLAACKPTIAFIIADIKFDERGNVTIVELGEGTRSYFKGHDLLYPKGQIWQRFWNILREKNIPMWHIGDLVKAGKEAGDIAMDTFKNAGGKLHSSLHILEKDPSFIRAISNARKKNLSYAGIVVVHHHTPNKVMFNYFTTTYPEIIMVNEAARLFVNNKFMTNLLFENDPAIAHLRPTCKTYRKKYSQKLLHDISTDFAHYKKLVIKPLNSANGWGVIITNHKNIGRELSTIFKNHALLENSDDTSYSYWFDDTNEHFIVEGFVPSKSIVINGRAFDATMRQVMVVQSCPEGITTHFIGSYWKLPALSLNEAGNATEKHKSHIKSGCRSSAPVDKKDDAVVQKALCDIMPRMYTKIVQTMYPQNL